MADEFYSEPLLDVFKSDRFPVLVPFKKNFAKNCCEWRAFLNVEKDRTDLLNKFYCSVERLWNGLGGGRRLANCSGGDSWPLRGVYFLFEDNELRLFDSSMHRLVRIGTHAVTAKSKSSLWNRIRTHRGSLDGKGNHRSSVFRLHVGSSIINKYGLHEKYPEWGRGQSADRDIRSSEADLENSVSEYLSKLTLLWLDIADNPSPRSDRAYIEQNSIALISGNFKPIDIASEKWLGNFCSNEAVRKSGLWNVNHTGDGFDSSFIDVLDEYIDITVGGKTPPTKSIAPSGWSRTKLSNLDNNQMLMFLERG